MQINQRYVILQTGVQTVRQWESGTVVPDVNQFREIAAFFGLPYAWFLDGTAGHRRNSGSPGAARGYRGGSDGTGGGCLRPGAGRSGQRGGRRHFRRVGGVGGLL